eukprot:CAMPEP_0113666056 /NCGR_PEP_ID=MMETSP0038_2-20120614/2654_1 /TAXON_ID=2898 /ORGANISM="Cryptomonas paramecium" /LENGTH=620 /DNA_ID=CAMNT_0000581489 /DNA_START=122 /DNA_END=1983 /DNA_ORIENTATION=+ /assembly_acc=CAM_ASM_000170
MKLKRFLLRYYPPGIILEYETNGEVKQKTLDLLELTVETDVEALLNQIIRKEPLITESKRPHVRKLLHKLVEKQDTPETSQFYLFKILRAHILPLTNCAFNKSGDRFITGSYDRTCKVWNTLTGEELLTLEGHKNVVYAIAFNNPYGDKIITGSFDKTCKVWNSETGELYHTLKGHATEIVCLSFNPQGDAIATGSMDNTAKLWDTETGTELATLTGHTAEIVSLSFNQNGDKLITGSFDHTTKLWDVRSGRCLYTFQGHRGEISSCQFDWEGNKCISGSIDRTCKLWDVRNGQCSKTLVGHNDEILDVSFNVTGSKLVTASADGTARVYNSNTGACLSILVGHEGEISKVSFSPQGTRLITASSDKTCRVWSTDTGECQQILEGHNDEIFSCAFNYEGDTIITGSKDNTAEFGSADAAIAPARSCKFRRPKLALAPSGWSFVDDGFVSATFGLECYELGGWRWGSLGVVGILAHCFEVCCARRHLLFVQGMLPSRVQELLSEKVAVPPVAEHICVVGDGSNQQGEYATITSIGKCRRMCKIGSMIVAGGAGDAAGQAAARSMEPWLILAARTGACHGPGPLRVGFDAGSVKRLLVAAVSVQRLWWTGFYAGTSLGNLML